jgi:UDP-glucose 4-epimerase
MLTHSKTICLVGGGGFIGINFVNFFLEKQYKVLTISKRPLNKAYIEHNTLNLRESILDIKNTEALIHALKDEENVVWLVNELVPAATLNSLVDDFSFNTALLIKFLERTFLLKKLKTFIYFSSGGTIYGDIGKFNLKEEDKKKPISAYGLSKLISEDYIQFFANKAHYNTIILRPANVYGRYHNLVKPQGIIGYALNAILNSKSIDLFGEGKVYRDFIHVNDVASAADSLLSKHNNPQFDVYNVGSQIPIPIYSMISFLENIAQAKIIFNHKPARDFDCEYNVLDITKLSNYTTWTPKIDLLSGLADVWGWLKST